MQVHKINIHIPELSLILLIGNDDLKTSFAHRHFTSSEIVSLSACQDLLATEATKELDELLHFVVSKRLQLGKLTVINAPCETQALRSALVRLARRQHVPCAAIVLPSVQGPYQQKLPHQEGFKQVYILQHVEALEQVIIHRQPLESNMKQEKGPFDIIGDVHGCFAELEQLVLNLGYNITLEDQYYLSHPQGRKLVFVGDLVDRGPKVPEVLRFVMDTAAQGMSFCVNGNHDDKLKRALEGRAVTISHGLEESLAQLEKESSYFKDKVINFLAALPSHYLFDEGRLAIAHAGVKEKYLERSSRRIRDYCMYGETTGATDEFGHPVRANWAKRFVSLTTVVYGHTPILTPEWENNTINIDTGCVFGGKLTALRYPERELVSVTALKKYYTPLKPIQS
ncbi:MAG: hypothetical protein BGO43_12220 [Gammaproteobacteria bacterium 39-13]|nr:MAG: hypothetical protein BGO43_12220 [Gammaproteobacteria bacterium 39-13]